MLEKKLLELERMTGAEKLDHWLGDKPWKIDGTVLRLPAVRHIHAGYIGMNDKGDITRMPPLPWRPCFGQVGAYLRHGGMDLVFNPKNGSYQKSRCARCDARNACHYVAEKRLRSSPQIGDAYQNWLAVGGRECTWGAGSSKASTPRLRLRDLLRELRNAAFKSVNDEYVLATYQSKIDERKQKDAERKRKQRARDSVAMAKTGDVDLATAEVLEAHRLVRKANFEYLAATSDAPTRIKRCPPETADFDSLVWVAFQRIALTGAKPNPSSCAAELARMGVGNDRNQNALRSKVSRSLVRKVELEKTPLPGHQGQMTWPAFSAATLARSLEAKALRDSKRASSQTRIRRPYTTA